MSAAERWLSPGPESGELQPLWEERGCGCEAAPRQGLTGGEVGAGRGSLETAMMMLRVLSEATG